jgi:hypothetical protein
VNTLDRIFKITGGPGCASASAGPEITLSQTSGSPTPATGASVGLTATLHNVASAAGTPVHFSIVGPNSRTELANANGSGQAAVSYAGAF